MNKNINYGTINKRGGAKNRLFKFVLFFCLGVVSLLGIGVKMTANAQVLDINTEKIVTSDNSLLEHLLDNDFIGYYDVVGFNNSKFEFRLYNFDGSIYDNSLFTNPPYLGKGGSYSYLMASGYAISTYEDIQGFCINASVFSSYLSCMDCSDFRFFTGTMMAPTGTYLFCSKYLYNNYLTMQNSSSGYTDTDLQNSYNTGYSDCQKDLADDLQQQYQDGYNIGKGEGINEGYWQGHEEGYSEGLKDNQDLVYNTGYNDGYSIGNTDGFEDGYSDGKDDGYNLGYDIGYDKGLDTGYTNGISDSQNDQNSFKSLMFSIVDAPFNVLSNAFDFEIFGINMSSFLIAIVSLLLVFFVIRKLM